MPDVAFAASPDHDGYMTCSQAITRRSMATIARTASSSSGTGSSLILSVLRAGGTSAATPSFAGMLTLLEQKYGNLGNINPTLYNLALTHPSVFHDITSGNNIVPCTVSQRLHGPGCTTGSFGWDAQTGYDLATGLGSIDGFNLYNALELQGVGGRDRHDQSYARRNVVRFFRDLYLDRGNWGHECRAVGGHDCWRE